MTRTASITFALLLLGTSDLACSPRKQPIWMPPPPMQMPIMLPPPAPSTGPAAILPESAVSFGFDRIAKYPEPGNQVPRSIHLSPDGKIATYLKSEDGSDVMSLFSLDLASGQESVLVRASDLGPPKKESQAEELRAERQRKRIKGITAYEWAEDQNLMVIPAEGDVYLRDKDGKINALTQTPDAEIDPQLCKTGEMVAYARGSELYALDIAKKREQAITKNAKAHVTRGQADFNGQEEFDEVHGFWWSPDCKKIAYLEVDEGLVSEVPVVGYRKGQTELMMQRYPLAGGTNPSVTMHFYDLVNLTDRVVQLPSRDPLYLGRVKFSPDSSAIYFEGLPRSQKEVSIYRAEAKKLEAKAIYTSKPAGWAEMGTFDLADQGKSLVVLGDRGGHDHLEVLDAVTGAEKMALTSGDWDVTRVARVGEDGTIYFVGTKDEPIGRQLYSVPLAGGQITRLTVEKGTHLVSVGKTGFVDVHSSSSSPPQADILTLTGQKVRSLAVAKDPDFDALGIRPPMDFTVPVDGKAVVYGQLLAPAQVDPTRRYPLIWMVYGGPGVQQIQDVWSPRLLWQYWTSRGFFVVQVDNRGGAGHGQAFAAPVSDKLGEVELKDQLAALDWIEQHTPVDPARVGIYGHSYGGFMSALAMLKAPGRFRAGVSASPVTDFRLYDSGYTERYLGDPKDDQAGYDGTNLTRLAGNLSGKLFLIHAMMDENVHFENSADLIDALAQSGKSFDLLTLPGERHGYRDPKIKAYVYKRITDFFVSTLAP